MRDLGNYENLEIWSLTESPIPILHPVHGNIHVPCSKNSIYRYFLIDTFEESLQRHV